MIMPDLPLPLMDSDHPDAEILAAYERVRALRHWLYAERDQREIPYVEDDRLDEIMLADEQTIYRGVSAMPSGAAARLALIATRLEDHDADTDRAFASGGIPSLVSISYNFDGHARDIIAVANDLVRLEWLQALQAWEQANRVYSAINRLGCSLQDEIEARGEDVGSVIHAIEKLADEFSDIGALDRLVRTIAPDWPGYRRKAEICLKEEYSEEAAPWLLRDVNYIMGGDQPAQVPA